MKVTRAGEHDVAIDVVCDVCGMSTRDGEGLITKRVYGGLGVYNG